MKLKQDRFRKARGGSSRLLDILCERAAHHLFFYQKDGPGIVKRLYLDRIVPKPPQSSELVCGKCKEVLGVKIVYKKENRLAYRVFVGAIKKKIVASESVK